MSLKVILADDHSIVRKGLRSLIEEQGKMQVAGEADNGRKVIELVNQHNPDVVVIDIGMPELNGIDATRHITTTYPDTKVIALSMHSDPRYIEQMLEAGASGYLLKDCAFEELIQAIDTVMSNRQYLCEEVQDQSSFRKKTKPAVNLSGREREVLQLLAEGGSTKEIASDLDISVKTVETHRQRIMDKLDIRSIAGLTKYALREGLIQLD